MRPMCEADDAFEDNDTLGAAKPLTVGEPIHAKLCPSGDASDFFSVVLALGDRVAIQVRGNQGTLNLDVLNEDRALLGQSRGVQSPFIELTAPADGTYYLNVTGCCAPSIDYSLEVTVN